MFWKPWRAGKFHVWPVAKVEQGIELLTGNGRRKEKRRWKIRAWTVLARLIDERCTHGGIE